MTKCRTRHLLIHGEPRQNDDRPTEYPPGSEIELDDTTDEGRVVIEQRRAHRVIALPSELKAEAVAAQLARLNAQQQLPQERLAAFEAAQPQPHP